MGRGSAAPQLKILEIRAKRNHYSVVLKSCRDIDSLQEHKISYNNTNKKRVLPAINIASMAIDLLLHYHFQFHELFLTVENLNDEEMRLNFKVIMHVSHYKDPSNLIITDTTFFLCKIPNSSLSQKHSYNVLVLSLRLPLKQYQVPKLCLKIKGIHSTAF